MEEQFRGLPEDMRMLGLDSTLASSSTMIQPRPSRHLPPAQAYGSGSHFVTHVLTAQPFPGLNTFMPCSPSATTASYWLWLTCCLVPVASEVTLEKRRGMFF